jgi:hypothetical protein
VGHGADGITGMASSSHSIISKERITLRLTSLHESAIHSLTCPASSDANGRASRQDIRDLIEKEMAIHDGCVSRTRVDYVDPEPCPCYKK